MANMTRWNPFREMAAMQNVLDHMLDHSWQQWAGLDESASSGSLALDIREDDTSYIVTAALPGVESQNINVRLDNDLLTIEGEIPEHEIEREGQQSVVQERISGHFSRSVRLPKPVNREAGDASFENGVLTLTLPKSPQANPGEIR
jgi:HSP20 family protein